jgi:hypothetical protein
MSLTKAIVILSAMLLMTVSAQCQAVQSPTILTDEEILSSNLADCRDLDEIEDVRISFNLETTITKQLFNLHKCLDVPVGIVFTDGVRDKLYQFNPSSNTTRGVLDSIVAVAPNYRWRLEKGVINLLTEADSAPLLDFRLSEFRAENASTRSILDSLENNEAVRKRGSELGFDGPQIYTLFIGLIDTRRYHLTCTNRSVRDVLNSISRLDGSSWMYAEYVDNGKKKYRFGFFTSLSAGE